MTSGGAALPELDAAERERYARHLLLPQVGPDGQRRLKAARVLVVGAGGLGSPAALYLAAAGVGTVGLVDFDVVDASNLQRQILHGTRDVGRPKVESARDRLADANPHVRVAVHPVRLTASNALAIVGAYDVVVDGSDNFATRYLVNDACVLAGRPLVHGSVSRFDGQATVLATSDGPCYRCLFPAPPPAELIPSCAEAGVLGVVPGLLGVIQAAEALKLLLGIGETLAGRLLTVDVLGMRMRTLAVRRDPACPACGTRELRTLADVDAACTVPGVPVIAPRALATRLASGDSVVLLDVREPHEWELERLHGARLVPLGALEASLRDLDRARETVVLCASGARSARAAQRLRAAGFERVWSLDGGLRRWREEVGGAGESVQRSATSDQRRLLAPDPSSRACGAG